MRTYPLSLLVLVLALLNVNPPAHAAGGSTALGKPHVQKPLSYRVDYRITPRYLTLRVVAEPAIMACGSITDLPLKASFDSNAADIVVGDFMFLQPMGTGAKKCGNPYKAASAEISIDRAALERKNVSQIRFWYQYMLDTFLILPDDDGNMRLQAPMNPKMYRLGNDLAKVKSNRSEFAATEGPAAPTTPAAPEPPAETVLAPKLEGLTLTTGQVLIDALALKSIRELATSRGLAHDPDKNVYIDEDEQFLPQLRGGGTLTIGTITVAGASYPVTAQIAP